MTIQTEGTSWEHLSGLTDAAVRFTVGHSATALDAEKPCIFALPRCILGWFGQS